MCRSLGPPNGLSDEIATALFRAFESAYYVGHMPVLLPKSEFVSWELRRVPAFPPHRQPGCTGLQAAGCMLQAAGHSLAH